MQKYKNVFAYVIEFKAEIEHVSNTNDKVYEYIETFMKHSRKAFYI